MTSHSPEPQREMLSLLTARIRDAYLRKPLFADGALDLVSACRLMSERGQNWTLVRDGERLGIFTTTDLRDAVLRGLAPAGVALRDAARFDLVDVQADGNVFEALWQMVKHRVHRLIVRDGDKLLGVLDQLDLVSFVASHSHIVALQIDAAESIDELRQAALQVDAMISLLHGNGVRIERITRIVSELNARLFERAWSMVAPAALVANSCLLVMGSEGRGEQIFKTDQDNALLLRDGFEHAEIEASAQRFSQALAAFGYPPCPGDIMLTNALWRQPVGAFERCLERWAAGSDAEGPMRLAIFFDASVVAGDASLLERVKRHVESSLAGQDVYLARFAAAADQFQEPGNWFTRLTSRRDEQPLDLKKLGIFPIVHGVRALSLRGGVDESGTWARLQQLSVRGAIDATLARDCGDALRFLMDLRLAHQLRQREQGLPPSNEVRPSELGPLEREPLQNALAIVRRLRSFLRQTFQLARL